MVYTQISQIQENLLSLFDNNLVTLLAADLHVVLCPQIIISSIQVPVLKYLRN